MFDNKSLEHVGSLADQAVQSADQAIKSTQRVAQDALDSVRDTSRQLRQQAHYASDRTVDYIRDDPIKAMLIAAATGAALMALVNLVSHSRERQH
ncbi:MAG: hypothetical protein PHS32_22555 [Rhodoferax sp.]|uniref:hypothetical protein n=1 Tax=Rhodoferax sp. TaxID=50421 RepID=UPI00260B4197|nr:hypothetical protein [Rhodoferax sp.]MDD5336529.1 hypothetical protein [Rhodoferax sp.]